MPHVLREEAMTAPVVDVTAEEIERRVFQIRTIASHALDPGPAREDLHAAADVIESLRAEVARLKVYGKNNEILAEEHFARASAAEATVRRLTEALETIK